MIDLTTANGSKLSACTKWKANRRRFICIVSAPKSN